MDRVPASKKDVTKDKIVSVLLWAEAKRAQVLWRTILNYIVFREYLKPLVAPEKLKMRQLACIVIITAKFRFYPSFAGWVSDCAPLISDGIVYLGCDPIYLFFWPRDATCPCVYETLSFNDSVLCFVCIVCCPANPFNVILPVILITQILNVDHFALVTSFHGRLIWGSKVYKWIAWRSSEIEREDSFRDSAWFDHLRDEKLSFVLSWNIWYISWP
jgi:hypothetical protein